MAPEWTQHILSLVQGILLLIVVFTAAVVDVKHGRINNWLCLGGVAAGLLLGFLRGGIHTPGAPVTFASSAAACGIGATLFLVFCLTGGLRLGDAKLMAAVGALVGTPAFVLWTIAATAFAGFPIAIAALMRRGELLDGLRRSMRSMVRLRPVGAGDTPPAEGKTDAAETPAAKPVTIPYAPAICVGVCLTIWLYADRGAELPFLT